MLVALHLHHLVHSVTAAAVIRAKRNWSTIEIRPGFSPDHVQDSGSEIDVRGDSVFNFPLGHSRAPDNERNPNVLLVTTFLAGRKAMLSNVEAVVRAINDIRVVQDTSFIELDDELLYQLVYRLQSPEPLPVVMVQVRHGRGVVLWKLPNPRRPARSIRVKVLRSGHRYVLEKIFVSLSGYRLGHHGKTSNVAINGDVRVWRDWSHAEEEGLSSSDGLIKEALGFVDDEVGCMLILMVDRSVFVTLIYRAQVGVCTWIKKEVCRCPSRGIG